MMSKKTKLLEFDCNHSIELMKPFLTQIPLSIQRRHASRACCGYGLPIHFVLHIAARKHTLNIGF